MSDASDPPGPVPDGRDPSRVGGAADPPTAEPVRCIRLFGFVLTAQAERDTVRITIAGDLAAGTALLVDIESIEVCRLRGESVVDLVLDLTAVTFLDATGVATLRRVHDRTVLQGRLRLGLPVAPRPSRLLAVAVDFGLLPPVFRPSPPTC
jgi:anti-anti-sigma regulatory factor